MDKQILSRVKSIKRYTKKVRAFCKQLPETWFTLFEEEVFPVLLYNLDEIDEDFVGFTNDELEKIEDNLRSAHEVIRDNVTIDFIEAYKYAHDKMRLQHVIEMAGDALVKLLKKGLYIYPEDLLEGLERKDYLLFAFQEIEHYLYKEGYQFISDIAEDLYIVGNIVKPNIFNYE